MKNNILYLIIVTMLALALLIWIGVVRQQDFKSYHLSIAQESTSSIAKAIEAYIDERKRLVAVFSQDHKELIERYALNPDDEEAQLQIKNRLTTYFPNHFSFTVADAEGIPYIDDFDGFVGDLCQSDLKKYANEGVQRPRIHPHEIVYHFDILAPASVSEKKSVLFVSFKADELGAIIKSSQINGHQMMLIYPQASQLIEVTDRGARINWVRDDYRMSEKEKMRVMHSSEVKGSSWKAVDLHEDGLFNNFSKTVFMQSALIFLAFLVMNVIVYFQLRREEMLRLRAENFKDEFLSVVSHELRTPLTSINGALVLVQNGMVGKVDEEAMKLLAIAVNNSERLTLLVNDILDLQKMNANKMSFSMEACDICYLVRNSVEDNQGYADKLDVSFVITECEHGITINVDPDRFEQIMANYLSNAAKFGAVNDAIDVSMRVENGYARVTVADHGEGIPESFRNRVFQKFSQADKPDTRSSGGSGLGLNIVKTMVEKQNGRVGFESKVGEGSSFYVEFPVVK